MINRKYPSSRLRRLRQSKTIRDLVAENTVSSNDLIEPMFLVDSKSDAGPVKSMPGVERFEKDQLFREIEESVKLENRSYLSTVMGLAFRKLDVFGYFKFVTAVKNINLLPNRDSMIKQKRAKAFSNFAFKGILGTVSVVYVILFALSFWQINSLNSKITNYSQIVQTHQERSDQLAKINKELSKLNKSLELSKSIKSNKKISFRVLAQIASAVPKRVRFTKIDFNGTNQILIQGLAASDQDILKLISNLNNKKLISQASLASMDLSSASGNTNNAMKGFLINCILENA